MNAKNSRFWRGLHARRRARGLKTPQQTSIRTSTPVSTPKTAVFNSAASQTRATAIKKLTWTQYLRLSFKFAKLSYKAFVQKHRILSRVVAAGLALLLLFGIVYQVQQMRNQSKPAELESAVQNLIAKPIPSYEPILTEDGKGGFDFNKDYAYTADIGAQNPGSKIKATFANNKTGAVVVNDPVHSVGFTLTPKFLVDTPKKNINRVIYPIKGKSMSVIYSAGTTGVKEDIIVPRYTKDELSFSYDIKLDSGTEARIEIDGSLAVYGVAPALLGNVATGSEADAQLLEKARQNSDKRTLLFKIPAPVVMEKYKKKSNVAQAKFTLDGKTLTVHAWGLKEARYPLSIDPSIYVETAAKLMRGNNESNVDFDTSNELIQKSQTTGARIDDWTANGQLTYGLWDHQTVAAGGYIYTLGGVEVYKKSFSVQGSNTETVPAGATSATIKAWGAGGGGGGGGRNGGTGGAGGGGGYVTATFTVSGGETLSIYIGGGGNGGSYSSGGNDAGGGGSGGGYTNVIRSGTTLVMAGGGGGGGGARDNTNGAVGGAGGGSSGVGENGGTVNTGNNRGPGGAGGTQAAAGAGGVNVSGGNDGSNGSGNNGGAGANGRNGDGTDGSGATGGLTGGGNGGSPNINTTRPGGGGGGSGYFGGGGGAASASSGGFSGGGGGGGSSYADAGGTSISYGTAGSGATPGNSSDTDRNGAGASGAAGASLGAGGVGGNGRVVITYTVSGSNSALTNKVSWAHLSSTNGTIESPNPGNGTCSGWCTDSAYYLPANRRGFSSVAYNGFLYVLGGTDGTNRVSTVYIAKLGANGEPQLWHPTDTNPNNWVYWYTGSLSGSTAKSYMAAYAYKNRMYVLGGETNASPNGITTVEYADILPNGSLGSWSTTGMQALPSGAGTHHLSVHVYNDVMYALGGFEGANTSSANLRNTVYYSKLTSTGAMNTWVATSSLISARASYGSNWSTVWGGYIYLAGGCTAVNGSGYCTTIASDTTLASINADGSLSEWNTIIGLTNQRIGYSFVSWQGGLYRVGGCSGQNASTGDCDSPLNEIEYGIVNPDGEASTVATSSPSGTSPCSGGSPYGCDLPSANVGNVMNATAIMNGYLYIMGGCTADNCGTASNGVVYTAIGSDGTLNKPAACTGGTYVDSYCVSPNNLPSGRASVGTAIFNGTLYLVGGWPSINAVSRTTVNNDGSIGAWTSQNMSGGTNIGATSVSYATAYARANPTSASTYPGNLYIFGGCTSVTTVSCTSQTQNVYKCFIKPDGSIETTGSTCTTTGQLQIGTVNTVDPITLAVTNGSGSGLGAHASAVYANYIYLIGGLGGGLLDITTIRYAKFDNSNNVVHPTTGSASGSWVEDQTHVMDIGRRRGAGFGYNGYLYVLGGYDASGGGVNGVLADIEFAQINVSDGSWGSFYISSVSINERWGLSVPVSNSYAYVVGGCTDGAAPTGCNVRTNTVQTFQIYNNDSGAVKSFTSASDDTFATDTDRWGASSTVLNGYVYVAGGCTSATDCTTATSNVQYAAISASDGSIGTWASATNGLPAVRAWGRLVTVGGTLYYLGGQDSTATNEQSTVYYTNSFSSGDINAAWSTATKAIGDTGSGGQARTKFGAAVWDGRIYVVGGLDGSAAATTTVYISPQLNSGGDISSNWSTGTGFNVARYGAGVTAYANNLYLFGGNDGTNYLNDGQFASIGYKTGTFTQSGNTVTGSGTTFTSAMVGSKFQYTDGSTATITAYSSATSITVDVSRTIGTASNYVILDGSVGGWGYTTSLPGLVSQGELFAANGYMYMIGGRSAASTCVPNTLIAPISANTTIATGNNPTGVGEWYETNVRYTGDRYGAAVAYDKGKFYMMGGGCTAPLSSTRHYYGVVKSQPQMAMYSRMIDTDTDVFPTGWLLNGIDNSIGARWVSKYRSMHDLDTTVNPNEDCGTTATMAQMTGWGYETSFGNTTLGLVNSYTPRNASSTTTGTITQSGTAVTGSGTSWTSDYIGATLFYADGTSTTVTAVNSTTSLTVSASKTIGTGQAYTLAGGNINCARYYYFSISIDASQTFGYPDTVSRGPTIADISLFFTSDPSKRLRHGKTFTGGEQQPLDTQCRVGTANPSGSQPNCPLP